MGGTQGGIVLDVSIHCEEASESVRRLVGAYSDTPFELAIRQRVVEDGQGGAACGSLPWSSLPFCVAVQDGVKPDGDGKTIRPRLSLSSGAARVQTRNLTRVGNGLPLTVANVLGCWTNMNHTSPTPPEVDENCSVVALMMAWPAKLSKNGAGLASGYGG